MELNSGLRIIGTLSVSFFPALWDIPGIEKRVPSINEFFDWDYDILEYKLKWTDHAEQFDLFRKVVNEHWEKAGDPVYLDIFLDNFGTPNPRVCIKDTLKVIDLSEFKEYSINLNQIDTSRWDNQLETKCKKYGIPWESPAFRLVLSSQKDDAVCDVHSELFYGVPIDQKMSVLMRKAYSEAGEKTNRESGKKDLIMLLLFKANRGDQFYLSIRNAVKKENLEKETLSFEVTGLDTSIWNSLLKTKFDQYKIPWRKPRFCLNLYGTK